jgi:hypothetical protein
MATADRCKETTTTTGTGNITLLGAVTHFQSFASAFPSFPASVSYAVVGQTGTEWEVGIGTLTNATTLVRTTVQDSSNSGSAVNFSAGTKDVFATITAQDMADISTALSGKAASVHTHAGSDITTGTVAPARLGTGTANSSTFLRGDGVWEVPAGGGDVSNNTTSANDNIAVFDGTTGKLIKDGGSTIANTLSRTNHTGTQSADTIVDGTTNKVFTATEQTKLSGIAAGAEVNVNADWNSVSGDSQILNKPTLGGAASLNVGTTAGTVAAGDDARFTDSRTPTTHAASHQSGGSDAIKLDDLATPDDNTDLDATTGRHGLLPKLGGGTTNFLRADGTWAAPSSGGGSGLTNEQQNVLFFGDGSD